MRNKIYFFLASSFILYSCGTQVNIHKAGSKIPSLPVLQIEPEERTRIATNPLFAAIIDNKSQEEIEEILSDTKNSLTSLNEKGDTPFAVAIQFRRENIATFLLKKLSCEDLYHKNNKGESYIYLASKYGYKKFIHEIANICYENKAEWLNLYDYEFFDLDSETLDEEIAIHVAANEAVAKALDYEYHRGALERPWYAFHKQNKNGETFIHTSVKNNRMSTLAWAVQHYCHENSWEKSDNQFKQIPAWVLREGWQIAQRNTWYFTQVMNYIDNEDNSALHLAAKTLNEKTIHLLSNCRWMNHFLENSKGNTALQEFLEALDPPLKKQSESIKETFVFLVNKLVLPTYWRIHFTHPIDYQNTEGETALHQTARLTDDFFYNYLAKYGDIHRKNKKGITPENIFINTRQNIQDL